MTLLSGDLSDLNTVRTTGTFTGKAAVDYTAGDASITITQANNLSGATTGKVTATIADDSLADLIGGSGINADTGNDGGDINAFTVTLTDTSVSAADLATLDARTSGTINLNDVTTLTGTLTELKAFIVAEDNFGNKSGISTISVSAENIDGAGGRGSVAELVTFHTDIRDSAGDGFNANAVINLTNVALLSGGVSDLLSAITLTDITGISGTDIALTATDASISIANANSLSGATDGVVTATIAESTSAAILDGGNGLCREGGA